MLNLKKKNLKSDSGGRLLSFKKYKEPHKKRKMIYFLSTLMILSLGIFIFYKSYAFYEEKKDFNVINGTVEDSGDSFFAYYVNNTITREFPTKDSGLTLDTTKSSCTSGVTISWDDEKWQANLNYSNYQKNSTTRTKCTLYFTKKKVLLNNYIRNLVKDANSSSNDVYTVPNKTSDSCTYTLAYDGTSDNNLRYVGANPCNYVKIDNEIWRIIGIMNNIDDGTGKKETRIKLIRMEAIGEYSWDTYEIFINTGYGINEWSQADLMKLLNPGYGSERVGGSLYYNNSSGNCYSDMKNATKACDFTTTGIKTNLKNLVGNTLWHTGTNGTNDWTSASNGLASHFYSYERSSNNGKICTSSNYCDDTVARTTTWQGKIGLMYPSDYGYATSGGTSMNRASCLAKELNKWYRASDCKNNDWLSDSSNNQWTLSPRAYSSDAYNVFYVSNSGHVNSNSANFAGLVRPSVYLIPSTSILGGEGTLENPYEIG
uniref:hypothetical protein n=1 Tax=Candidatus Ventrenecus sp. TaxID=3085654 RepID=UPI0040251512